MVQIHTCLPFGQSVHLPAACLSVWRHPFPQDIQIWKVVYNCPTGPSRCLLSLGSWPWFSRSLRSQRSILELSIWNFVQILVWDQSRCLSIVGGHYKFWVTECKKVNKITFCSIISRRPTWNSCSARWLCNFQWASRMSALILHLLSGLMGILCPIMWCSCSW